MDSSLKGMPKITVLMPVYNCELYIKEAIDSVLNQTYTDYEFLIIDDASTDKTVEICKSFEDNRIRIIEKEENTGLTDSLNYAITISRGKYIARMDGDDINLPQRFERQFAFMEANENVVLCGTSFSIIGQDKCCTVPEYHEEIKIRLLYANCIVHPSVMLRKDVLINNNFKYDKQMEPAEDYDLWVRLSLIGELHNLQEVLFNYRVHYGQVSFVKNTEQIEITKHIRLKLLSVLNTEVLQKHSEVFLNAIDVLKTISYHDFLVLLSLKKMMLKANRTNFFNKDGFLKYWSDLEAKFSSYYFKNRTSYSLVILRQYLIIFSKMDNRLSTKETIKMAIKSLINYKVK